MKKNLLTLSGLLLAAMSINAQTTAGGTAATILGGGPMILDSLTFTGGIQTYTVPCGVTTLSVTAYGAQGADGAVGGNSAVGGTGGRGGAVSATLSVTPGQILNVFVGGAGAAPTGGFNGGANGGSTNAGGGGGATDIRYPGTSLGERLIIAAGGGGGGRAGCETAGVSGGNGGGGGSNGVAGVDAPTSGGSAGGGQGAIGTAGGAAGTGCGGFLGSPGAAGSSGTGGVGGAGQSCCCFSFGSIPGGGGGGGGLLGGGGGGGGSAGTTGCSGNDKGGGGGGAGGTNDYSGAISGMNLSSTRGGNGAVYFSYPDMTPVAEVISGNATLCAGATTTYSVPTDALANNYQWTVSSEVTIVSGQGTNSILVMGASAGTATISVYGENTTCSLIGPTTNFTVTVNAQPSYSASASVTTVCDGAPSTLNVTGSDSYIWAPGSLTGASVSVTPSTTTTYTVTGIDGNGCSNTATTTVTVNSLPVVTYVAPTPIVCTYNPVLTLAGGAPAGGTYTGTAVTAGVFDPAVAGAGTFPVTYTYTDANSCVNTAVANITVSLCTGINNAAELSSVHLVSNLVDNQLQIRWEGKAVVTSYEITDAVGRKVASKEINSTNAADVSVDELADGNYVLTLTSKDGNKAALKFAKRK